MSSSADKTIQSRFATIVGVGLIVWTCIVVVVTGYWLWNRGRQEPDPVEFYAALTSSADTSATPELTQDANETASTTPPADLPTVTTAPQVVETLPPGTSPSGKIVFTCYINGFDEICIMDPDGSNQKRLTENQATDFYASLGPDSRTIVFSSRRDGRFDIYSMKIDGSNQRRLTHEIGSAFAPTISPDG